MDAKVAELIQVIQKISESRCLFEGDWTNSCDYYEKPENEWDSYCGTCYARAYLKKNGYACSDWR